MAADQTVSNELHALVDQYRIAREKLREAVANAFPLGCPVRLEFHGTSLDAVVHSYASGQADHVALLFENGNVWDRDVRKLTRIGV